MGIAVSDQTGWEELIPVDAEGPAQEREGGVGAAQRADPRARPGRVRGAQHFQVRPALPRGAGQAAQGQAPVGARRHAAHPRGPSRVQIAEKTINYPKFEVRGRHIIDTFLLLQLYDVGTRELESFGLKDAARHFGIVGGGHGRAVGDGGGRGPHLPGGQGHPAGVDRGPGGVRAVRAGRRARNAGTGGFVEPLVLHHDVGFSRTITRK